MDLTNKLLPIKDDFLDTLPKHDIPSKGVYFLFYNEKLIYIGQSKHILLRFDQHLLTKKFTSFSYIKCTTNHEASTLEREFINKYNPPLNIALKAARNVENSIHFFYKNIMKKEFDILMKE